MKNSHLLFSIIIFLGVSACQQAPSFYKKEFSAAAQEQLAQQMLDGCGKYYQGSAPEQFLLQEANRLNPNNAALVRELGVPFLKRGFAAEYESYYTKAVQLDPKGWQGWRGYLYLYFYRDYERAIADFDAMDILTPNFVDYPQSTSVHYMRAVAYLQLDDYDKALSYLDQHITEELRTNTEKYIDPKTFLYQGIAYYKKGDFSKADQSFNRGLKHSPQNADLWFWSAKAAVKMGAVRKATSSLEEAQTQFTKDYKNQRPYVEEFFEIYQADIDEVKEAISFLN